MLKAIAIEYKGAFGIQPLISVALIYILNELRIETQNTQSLIFKSRYPCIYKFSIFETEMSSFWWNFHHWLHWKLSK